MSDSTPTLERRAVIERMARAYQNANPSGCVSYDAIEAALDASGNDELEWLDAHKSMELTWGELDGDMSECAWRVHRVNGGYNDREWTLIATGETALEALRAAIARTQEQSRHD